MGVVGYNLRTAGSYNDRILSDNPVAFWPCPGGNSPVSDITGNSHTAIPQGSGTIGTTSLPNGHAAMILNGSDQYLQVASSPALSINTTGQLSVEAWIRPDTLDMPGSEPDADGPLVNYLGKGSDYGSSGHQEYYLRFYNKTGVPVRPNRTSAYAFNPAGGLGAGSYAQDTVTAGTWMFITAVFDTVNLGGDGWGTVSFYKNGILRQTSSLGDPYDIVPVAGPGLFYIGTAMSASTTRSFWLGAIGKVAIYSKALSATRVAMHYQAL